MTPITEKSLADIGFTGQMKMYRHPCGWWVCLNGGFEWVLARGPVESVVETIEDINRIISDK